MICLDWHNFLHQDRRGSINHRPGSILLLGLPAPGQGECGSEDSIEQHELAEKYYAAQPKIDERTKEIKEDVKKAIDAGDIDRVRELYDRLRKHQGSSSKGKTPRKTRNE